MSPRGDRPHRHQPAGPRVLGDHERAIFVHLGDRKTDAPERRYLFEKRIIPAGRLRAALDDVPRRDRAGQLVPVVAPPIEAPGGRAHHQRCIGHAAGDHDVGPARERLADAPSAQIGVGGDWLDLRVRQRSSMIEVRQPLARSSELFEAPHQVVAVHPRDLRVQTETGGQHVDLRGEPARVQPARVRHHADLLVEALADYALELLQEGRHISGIRILLPRAMQDGHGQLGEVVAGEHIDRPAAHHFLGGRETVSPKTGAVSDSQHARASIPTVLAYRPDAVVRACHAG